MAKTAKTLTVGDMLKVTTTLDRKDGGKVTWIVKAEVTAADAHSIEWKTVEVVAYTAHGEDAPHTGGIARAVLPLLIKTGRVEIL